MKTNRQIIVFIIKRKW